MMYNCEVFITCSKSVCFAHRPRSKSARTSPFFTHAVSPAKPLLLASLLGCLDSGDSRSFSCVRRENAQCFQKHFESWGEPRCCYSEENLTVSALPIFFFNLLLCMSVLGPCHCVIATSSGKQTHSEGQCRSWSAVYYTGSPQAESTLSQGPRPVFVKT